LIIVVNVVKRLLVRRSIQIGKERSAEEEGGGRRRKETAAPLIASINFVVAPRPG